MMSKEVQGALPRQPSRVSGRWYVVMIFILAVVEAVVVGRNGYEHWAVLASINALPIMALLISKASTTLDLNKWMDSATRMVEAKFGK